jgi:signal transduction histidine kinase
VQANKASSLAVIDVKTIVDNIMNHDDELGLIVHSYNNFLSGIMGFTELALMESEQEDVNQRLEMAMASANESVVFGQALLSSIGRLQVKMANHKLVPIFENMKSQLQKEEGIILKLNPESTQQNLDELALQIKTNPQWLTHCLSTLMLFIRDYFKQNTVILKLGKINDTVIINLAINRQLSQQDSEQLFQPFYSSRNLLGQKCVGLAMLAGFLKQMSGSICWRNGQGFMIEIASTQ